MAARVALITGGAQGIGRAIALRLARDGLNVAIVDLPGKEDKMATIAQEAETAGVRTHYTVGDVTSEESVVSAIGSVVRELGRLDVMVANAGIALGVGISVLDTTAEDWNTTFSVNSLGTMLCFKHAAKQMIKQGGGGRLIGACSAAGKQGFANGGAYSASKFAMRGLTQVMAQELRQHNITVNTYAPGFVQTAMFVHPDDDKHGGPGATYKKLLNAPPDTPATEPHVIAGLVSYLVSQEASFVTGQSVSIDGGMIFS